MAASSPWAVYRRTPDGFDRVATVTGAFEGTAMAAACRILPALIVAHAHTGDREPVDFSLIPAPTRRSRRHHA